MHRARMGVCTCARECMSARPIVWTGVTSRSQGNGDRPPLRQKEKGGNGEWGGQGSEGREKVSEGGGGDRGWTRARERERDGGRERNVTRGITWCIDRCAASTRAIPTYCCQPSYLPQALYPFPSHSVCSHSPPTSPTSPPFAFPFTLFIHSPASPPSLLPNLHSPPTSASATNPLLIPNPVLSVALLDRS